MAENRRFRREKRRTRCEFHLDGAHHIGFLADLSARGLFIQSTYVPYQGRQIQIRVHDRALGSIDLWGRVARTRSPHPALTRVVPRGFGVELDSAPPAYFDLLMKIGLG